MCLGKTNRRPGRNGELPSPGGTGASGRRKTLEGGQRASPSLLCQKGSRIGRFIRLRLSAMGRPASPHHKTPWCSLRFLKGRRDGCQGRKVTGPLRGGSGEPEQRSPARIVEGWVPVRRGGLAPGQIFRVKEDLFHPTRRFQNGFANQP